MPRIIESMLAALERQPWSALYRIAIGFMFFPIVETLLGRQQSFLSLAVCFLVLLILLRVAPAVTRRVLPFSNEVRMSWKDRRQLAKKYDSYQWQKLFWLGLGISAYVLMYREFRQPYVAITAIVTGAGALGLVFWSRLARTARTS